MNLDLNFGTSRKQKFKSIARKRFKQSDEDFGNRTVNSLAQYLSNVGYPPQLPEEMLNVYNSLVLQSYPPAWTSSTKVVPPEALDSIDVPETLPRSTFVSLFFIFVSFSIFPGPLATTSAAHQLIFTKRVEYKNFSPCRSTSGICR